MSLSADSARLLQALSSVIARLDGQEKRLVEFRERAAGSKQRDEVLRLHDEQFACQRTVEVSSLYE